MTDTRALRQTLLLATAFATAFLNGCGRDQGPERVVVSGIVTYNGNPIPDGSIRFTPVASSLTPSAGATIVEGKYRVDAHGGVPAGRHRIEVEAYRMVPIPVQPGGLTPPDGLVRQQYLSNSHNRNSQLEITIEPGSQNITKDFALTD